MGITAVYAVTNIAHFLFQSLSAILLTLKFNYYSITNGDVQSVVLIHCHMHKIIPV